MTPQLQAIFKKSLKSNRWDKINLGTPENYTHDDMVARWVQEKNKWLHVSTCAAFQRTFFHYVRVHKKDFSNEAFVYLCRDNL